MDAFNVTLVRPVPVSAPRVSSYVALQIFLSMLYSSHPVAIYVASYF